MMETPVSDRQPTVYLNTAAAGLVSQASLEASRAFEARTAEIPSSAFAGWLDTGLPALREKMGRLLGCEASRLAFVPNFSFGLHAIAHALSGKVRRVLAFDSDYPSLNLPFTLGGFELVYLPSEDGFSVPFSRIQALVAGRRVEVVVLSHVQYLTGFMLDIEALAKLCRTHGVWLVIDATQSMGALDYALDALAADVVISSGYKWLNGGYGSAVMYMGEAFLRAFPPRIAGMGSLGPGGTYTPSLRSYEPGHFSVSSLLQLEAAVSERLSVGQPVVEAHDRALIRRLAESLSRTPFEIRGGTGGSRASILSVDAEPQMAEYLSARGIIVTWRRGMIRVSPHFYNTDKEIDHLADILSRYPA